MWAVRIVRSKQQPHSVELGWNTEGGKAVAEAGLLQHPTDRPTDRPTARSTGRASGAALFLFPFLSSFGRPHQWHHVTNRNNAEPSFLFRHTRPLFTHNRLATSCSFLWDSFLFSHILMSILPTTFEKAPHVKTRNH